MKKVLFTATLLLSTSSLMHAASNDVIAVGGERFSVTPVAGDGDCAFTAIGKSRADVVAALKGAVEDHHSAYSSFNSTRGAIHDLVESLTPASSDIHSVLSQVESLIANSAVKYSPDPSALTPSMLAASALAEFRLGVDFFTATEFASAKLLLQSRIENMYYERYEAFQSALKQELQESGIAAGDLNTKMALFQGIEGAFLKNQGTSSWLPMGLIFGVQERLGLNLAVWSSRGEDSGKVRLYQFNAPNDNVWDPSVQHVVWSGGHFDKLTPQ